MIYSCINYLFLHTNSLFNTINSICIKNAIINYIKSMIISKLQK